MVTRTWHDVEGNVPSFFWKLLVLFNVYIYILMYVIYLWREHMYCNLKRCVFSPIIFEFGIVWHSYVCELYSRNVMKS